MRSPRSSSSATVVGGRAVEGEDQVERPVAAVVEPTSTPSGVVERDAPAGVGVRAPARASRASARASSRAGFRSIQPCRTLECLDLAPARQSCRDAAAIAVRDPRSYDACSPSSGGAASVSDVRRASGPCVRAAAPRANPAPAHGPLRAAARPTSTSVVFATAGATTTGMPLSAGLGHERVVVVPREDEPHIPVAHTSRSGPGSSSAERARTARSSAAPADGAARRSCPVPTASRARRSKPRPAATRRPVRSRRPATVLSMVDDRGSR